MELRDFFVSYTQTDKKWAEQIVNILKSKNYTIYFQETDINAGQNILEKMNTFLEKSRGFIAVTSDDYFTSEPCRVEWWAAFNKHMRTYGNYSFYPFRVTDVRLPELTQPIARISLFRLSNEEVAQKIIDAVNKKTTPQKTQEITTTHKPDSLKKPLYYIPESNPHFSGRNSILADTLRFYVISCLLFSLGSLLKDQNP